MTQGDPRPTGCLIMAVLSVLLFLLSIVGAAASGEAPAAMLIFAIPVWISLLPVALLPRRAAIIAGTAVTAGFALMAGLMALLAVGPTSGDGMGQLGALLLGVGCAALALVHAGATLTRWLSGRPQA